MRAAVISLGSKSSLWVAEAMKKYFDHVDMINLKEVEVALGKEAALLYQGKPFPDYDCVYVKGSFRYAPLLRSITSMLQGKVAYLPLPADGFTIVHNKLLTHLALEQHNIPMPRTYVGPGIESAKDLLKRTKYPVVMKFPEGTHGKGVMFADSYPSASSLLDALGALNQPFLIQEYVESGGVDIRVIVVGNKAVAGMKRIAKVDEKRANTHAGGMATAVVLSRDVASLAVRAAKALNLDVCAVDILESPLGPMVIEANISPGLQGISSVSPVDIPVEIAKYFAKQTHKALEERRTTQGRHVMKELQLDEKSAAKHGQEGRELITNLQFKGERVVLPALVTKMAGLSDLHNYVIKAKKGRLEIEEFRI